MNILINRISLLFVDRLLYKHYFENNEYKIRDFNQRSLIFDIC